MINLYSNQSTPVLYDTMTTIQESHLTTCNSCIEQLAMTSGDKGERCNLQSRHYLLAIFFLFCGVLLSSLNQSSAPQHVEGPLPRPAWLADLYTLSLASSRVVLPGDPDYSQVVQVSPGAGAGAPPGQVSPLSPAGVQRRVPQHPGRGGGGGQQPGRQHDRQGSHTVFYIYTYI